jgi:Tc toxin complex TcA C-terminal TcB-binding domain
MASLTQAIATYSFVDRPQIDLGTVDPADADAAMLARIGSLMASAASSFNGRNYDAAITGYHAAESLIYAHLDPQWVPELGGKFRPLLPRDPALFPQLLSATTQWLNILAVPTPASPVRPTTAVNAQLLSSVSRLHGAGLTPVSANPLATAEALADIRLASIYTDQQNTAASATVVARAKTLDSTIATTLTPAATAAVAPAIAARPVDVSPAAPSGTAAISTIARPISQPIQRFPTLPITVLAQKQVGLLTGSAGQWAVKPVQWTASGNPDPASIQTLLYAPHVTATVLPDTLLNVTTPWEQSAVLPHDYYYVIPLALAECYQAMGDFATAETYFILAASYAFINTAIEGPYVWVQLATLYLAWGNSAYQQGDLITATAAYSKAITFDSTTPPSTPLYTLAGLAAAATIAKTLIPQLTTLATNGVSSVSADDVAIAAVLLQIYAKEKQINAGLDYWANYSLTVPIWTFAYLQQVAITVTQLALQAEQEVVNYWAQADQATLTQTQLTNQAAQAKAQISSAQQQLIQAQDQVSTYQAALTLAQTRATDAAADASEYASVNSQAILIQAVGTQVGGGDNGDFQGVSNDASQLLAGQTVSGDSETLSATNQLAASRLNQSYQVDSMTRTTTEMQQAVTQAQTELTAANAQVAVAQANVAVAQLASNNAAQTVAVFNADTFSPQVWRSMGNFVKSIYDRYMSMALQAAKQMQQAYNFENDTTLTYINDAYPGLVDGLFGADSLMADIQSFTNDLITSKRGKKQYVKTSISLATNYGYLFETQLRKTGTIAFETTLDDFDTVFPGSYQGRIQKVSVAIQGIVPPTGVSGYLSNGGVSIYRLPSDIATSSNVSKIRLWAATETCRSRLRSRSAKPRSPASSCSQACQYSASRSSGSSATARP